MTFLLSGSAEQIGLHALKIMELMQLGRIEKDSELMDLKFKSLQSRWYGCKQNRPKDNKVANGGVYISRDTLITLSVTQGNTTTLVHYRVFAIFSKHYNKWFLHWDQDEVLFENSSFLKHNYTEVSQSPPCHSLPSPPGVLHKAMYQQVN